jgi:hypothetical protein
MTLPEPIRAELKGDDTASAESIGASFRSRPSRDADLADMLQICISHQQRPLCPVDTAARPNRRCYFLESRQDFERRARWPPTSSDRNG